MYRAMAYVWRDLLRWFRSPLNLVSTLIMPCAWLLFMGLVMPVEFEGSYLNFITPSILVLTIMSAGLSGGSSIMFDKTLGYLNRFLAMPAPRESILIGKIIFITIKGLLQSTVILFIAILIGADLLPLSTYLIMYLVLFLFGIFFASLGTTVSLYLNNYDSYAAFQGFVTMPLYFTSTALISYDMMPYALNIIAHCNPLSYAINATREISTGTFPLLSIIVLLVLSIVMVLLCSYKFRKATIG